MNSQPDIAPIFAQMAAANAERRDTFGLTERRAALKALGQVIRAERAAIAAAVAQDIGRPAPETDLVEVMPLLSEITTARRNLRRWMQPRRIAPTLAMLGTTARVHPEPKGVVLIMAPWNFPLMLCLSPLISALAAGNAAIIKPSEFAPATAELLQRLLEQALPKGLVHVAIGGPDVAEALLDLPFDHIFFTGSPAIGRKVMASAARHLVPVTLELGGKNPVIVTDDADMARAAGWIGWGKVLNAGQVCVGPDHAYVPSGQVAAFVATLQARMTKLMAEDRAPRIANRRHYDRLTAWIADAAAKGAAITQIGADDPAKLIFAPRLVQGVTPDMALAQEELFGPILPIFGYDDLDQVLAHIRAQEKPLALYVFARDSAKIAQIRHASSSGSFGVNLTVLPFGHSNLPFGGVGMSGMGAAHGAAGFAAFSHMKPVLRNRLSLLPLVFPPYGPMVRRLIRVVLRLL